MRRSLVVCGSALVSSLFFSLVPACATAHDVSVAQPLGGSVTDLDRGTGALDMPWTGGQAGGPETEGVAVTGWGDEQRPAPIQAAAPPPSLVAGPIQPGARGSTIEASRESTRRLQHALRERGYYQGQESGLFDPALAGALRRFQADHDLPMSGQLDAQTAAALDLVPAPSQPPPSPHAG